MLKVLEEITRDLSGVAAGIIDLDRAQVDRGREWIEALRREYPIAHGILISVLYKQPADVMRFLCMLVPDLRRFKDSPRILEYIALLQTELRGNNDSQRTDRPTKAISRRR